VSDLRSALASEITYFQDYKATRSDLSLGASSGEAQLETTRRLLQDTLDQVVNLERRFTIERDD